MIKRFFIYGLLGWNIEVFWTGLHSLLAGDVRLEGVTYLWMIFVYGSAAFILEPIHHIIQDWRWPVRGLMWVIIIWGIEYASGLIFQIILGVSPWFYTGAYAVDGLVRLDYAPAWFIAGMLFERIHFKLDALNL